MKFIPLILCVFFVGCGLNPPQPPQPKGERIPVNKPSKTITIQEASNVQKAN